MKYVKQAIELGHVCGIEHFGSAIAAWDRGLQHLVYTEIPGLVKEMNKELDVIRSKFPSEQVKTWTIKSANEILDLGIDFHKLDMDLEMMTSGNGDFTPEALESDGGEISLS